MRFKEIEDWRLPDRKEILSIIEDSKYFPELQQDTYFFSSTIYVDSTGLCTERRRKKKGGVK